MTAETLALDILSATQNFGDIPDVGDIVEYPFRSNRRWTVMGYREDAVLLERRPPIPARPPWPKSERKSESRRHGE